MRPAGETPRQSSAASLARCIGLREHTGVIPSVAIRYAFRIMLLFLLRFQICRSFFTTFFFVLYSLLFDLFFACFWSGITKYFVAELTLGRFCAIRLKIRIGPVYRLRSSGCRANAKQQSNKPQPSNHSGTAGDQHVISPSFLLSKISLHIPAGGPGWRRDNQVLGPLDAE
jgi:hypothetical protein